MLLQSQPQWVDSPMTAAPTAARVLHENKACGFCWDEITKVNQNQPKSWLISKSG